VTDLLVRGAARILLGGPEWGEARGDVLVRGTRIAAVGGDRAAESPGARVVDARGLTVLPGLVQSHVHLCQTLFRGLAEDLPLLPWLRTRIWPLEAAHDPASLRASARLSACELLLGGTTAILDMGTTRHHDAVFEVLEETGLRAASGKAMMDEGDGVPVGLLESTLDSLRDSFALAERWDGAAGGRLRYAFAPRFALSCSDVLFREVVALAKGKYLLHTHAAENEAETRRVAEIKGRSNVEYLDGMGFLGPGTVVAHCIWLGGGEPRLLASSGTRAAHCPGTNLKLGSGLIALRALRDAGVHLSIGADGAPANNTLDAFSEMRAAAHLAAVKSGPGSVTAREVLTMATRGGAEAIGFGDVVGRLEPGREADLIAVDLDTPHAAPADDAPTALVYSARPGDVRHVLVQGEVLVEGGRLARLDPAEVVREGREARRSLLERARLHGYDPAREARHPSPGGSA
jgi:cytosine/adenosine deaminase-related metal-dependent hydrolase